MYPSFMKYSVAWHCNFRDIATSVARTCACGLKGMPQVFSQNLRWPSKMCYMTCSNDQFIKATLCKIKNNFLYKVAIHLAKSLVCRKETSQMESHYKMAHLQEGLINHVLWCLLYSIDKFWYTCDVYILNENTLYILYGNKCPIYLLWCRSWVSDSSSLP